MSKAEQYYREVNSLSKDEFPILAKDDILIIKYMEDFHDEQVKNNDSLDDVSQQRELLITLLIENIDKFVADDNFVKMSNSYKKLKAIYCG